MSVTDPVLTALADFAIRPVAFGMLTFTTLGDLGAGVPGVTVAKLTFAPNGASVPGYCATSRAWHDACWPPKTGCLHGGNGPRTTATNSRTGEAGWTRNWSGPPNWATVF